MDGVCDWDKEQDVFELHVRPPVGSAWRWVGGGIGTTQRPDIFRHNIYWAQFEPDGTLNEGSPRRHTSYELVFDGDTVSVGESVFQFEPGMRLNIQFLDNWSVVASEASRAGR
ncbi:MAG: hypothetical protein HKN59_09090 [Gammaproteobacteria bacterium]|nr:hypothetical protein [Gammaproteobacteria bacterium]